MATGPVPVGYGYQLTYGPPPKYRRSTRVLKIAFAGVIAICIAAGGFAVVTAWASVPLPDFPTAVGAGTLGYYDINGSTEQALISQIQKLGPVSCEMDDAIACFRYKFIWTDTEHTDPATGTCSVSAVNLTPVYETTLPRWAGPSAVPGGLVSWWQKVHDHVAWHEAQHLAIAQSYESKIKQAILDASCGNAAARLAVAPVMDAERADQDSFDQRDSDWTWPSYLGP